MSFTADAHRMLDRRLLLSGLLFGVGVAAFVDETVLHQLLHWHHFYDRSTTGIGLVSDGLFHAFGWFAAVAGLFLFADVRRRAGSVGGLGVGRWWPGVLVGAGAFQAYDGSIQHKLMRIHQIRYEVIPTEVAGPGPYPEAHDIALYDTVWMVLAVLFIVVGVLARRRGSVRRPTGGAGSSLRDGLPDGHSLDGHSAAEGSSRA